MNMGNKDSKKSKSVIREIWRWHNKVGKKPSIDLYTENTLQIDTQDILT